MQPRLTQPRREAWYVFSRARSGIIRIRKRQILSPSARCEKNVAIRLISMPARKWPADVPAASAPEVSVEEFSDRLCFALSMYPVS